MMIALTPRIPICRTAQYFNPHFRKGSDQGGDKSSPNCDNFNPHFRKGSDIRSFRTALLHGDFNPHFRKGSDRKQFCRSVAKTISIHTSAREVTSISAIIRRRMPHSPACSQPQRRYLSNVRIWINRHLC